MKIKKCALTGASFEVTERDLYMLEKLSPTILGEKFLLPPPSLCPQERQRRRIAFRNERKLYHRKCALTGKAIISMYSPDKPYTIYDQREWWGDAWDAREYARPFDFTRPFFEQFQELLHIVPRVALLNKNSINCEYTNISADNKNCYLLIESSNNDSCHYSYWMQKCTSCIDCSFCYLCEKCYEATNCNNCYAIRYSSDCENCSESAFLQSCRGCTHCIGCINLTQQHYCILNVQYSKEEYEQKISALTLDTHSGVTRFQALVTRFFLTQPYRHAEITHSEDCTGNYISDSKGCTDCFHALDAQDCAHCVHVWRNAKDCVDCDTAGRDAELIYYSINSGISVYHNLFCMTCWSSRELLYCDTCISCHDCFGSVGLRQKEYCILNTPYTRSEYEKMLKKIIRHLMETGEWGEFFPPSLSFYGYNETAAADFYPLSRTEALTRGFTWYDGDAFSQFQGASAQLPDHITEAQDTIIQQIFLCEVSQKPYKIILPELTAYRELGVPLPHRSPNQRHLDRLATRTPREMYKRQCSTCEVIVDTPYAPDRPEKIVCNDCYRKNI